MPKNTVHTYYGIVPPCNMISVTRYFLLHDSQLGVLPTWHSHMAPLSHNTHGTPVTWHTCHPCHMSPLSHDTPGLNHSFLSYVSPQSQWLHNVLLDQSNSWRYHLTWWSLCYCRGSMWSLLVMWSSVLRFTAVWNFVMWAVGSSIDVINIQMEFWNDIFQVLLDTWSEIILFV